MIGDIKTCVGVSGRGDVGGVKESCFIIGLLGGAT